MVRLVASVPEPSQRPPSPLFPIPCRGSGVLGIQFKASYSLGKQAFCHSFKFPVPNTYLLCPCVSGTLKSAPGVEVGVVHRHPILVSPVPAVRENTPQIFLPGARTAPPFPHPAACLASFQIIPSFPEVGSESPEAGSGGGVARRRVSA